MQQQELIILYFVSSHLSQIKLNIKYLICTHGITVAKAIAIGDIKKDFTFLKSLKTKRANEVLLSMTS